jgi:hypothetical protein
MDIDHFDIEEDIIICISLNQPKTILKATLREPLEDIKISDVKYLNSKDRGDSSIK